MWSNIQNVIQHPECTATTRMLQRCGVMQHVECYSTPWMWHYTLNLTQWPECDSTSLMWRNIPSVTQQPGCDSMARMWLNIPNVTQYPKCYSMARMWLKGLDVTQHPECNIPNVTRWPECDSVARMWLNIQTTICCNWMTWNRQTLLKWLNMLSNQVFSFNWKRIWGTSHTKCPWEIYMYIFGKWNNYPHF